MKGESPSAQPQGRNRLADELSPYLLQHAENPIWWYPWGPEAFEAARRENKPVFLSIGYSTCYWCHFMEKECFEKQDIADLLNRDFIAIKVDREERPDVDAISMTALVAMRGNGGWPISMFLTPDGKPFFGASTIPHDAFRDLLEQITAAWRHHPDQVRDDAAQLMQTLVPHLERADAPSEVNAQPLISFADDSRRSFDTEFGGFGDGTKFPQPHGLSALLRVYRRSGDSELLSIVTRTLQAMARGGLHDLLGGGFHRYCVDRAWEAPHFEKMLYDNAGLAVAYIEGYQVTRDEEFARVARSTLDWTLKEMTDAQGGFFSAQDAGDYGREGEYYVWTTDELQSILTADELRKVKEVYRIRPEGNFENGRHIFHVPPATSLPDPESDPVLASARRRLLDARAKRERPRLDDKVLTSWNGLMIAAMAKGYQALGDRRYLEAAERAATFLQGAVRHPDGHLFRRWRQGEAGQRPMLDDYAFLIHGLIELYQSDFKTNWLTWAIELQRIQDQNFADPRGGYFLDDGLDRTILSRRRADDDMAMPSGNSIAILNLLQLADLTRAQEYRARADAALAVAASGLSRSASASPSLLMALDYRLDHSKEIAIAGPAHDAATLALLSALHRAFLPNQVIALSGDPFDPDAPALARDKPMKNKRPTAYVCERGSCRAPTTDPAEAVRSAATFVQLQVM